MNLEFSLSGAPFKPSSKKKEMKVEYKLLNDIMAKYLTVKAGYFFDAVIVRFDFTVVINTGITVTGQVFYIAFLLL
ncbi:hypothetical protein F511_43355 [Dorcoceras hygrometricum]|uniref:Uncharacterized protein n=1 Tax=Dorcoceras hygrometricum TaxID=472368 RepID=A0A2Z7CPY9_9LAMI|nr:hypothetical protein F511_43355 [Dorcoceras hygrometricum]